MKLDIPFYSQRDNRYRNDCGAAVLACLVNRPVDDVLTAIGQEPHKPLNFHKMYDGLRHYGLQFAYRNDVTPATLRHQLDQGYPVICLLTYGRLPKELQALDFDGGHWALVTGYENGFFYVHDPLRAAEEGGYQIWDAESLNMAMRDTSAGNLPHQGLIIKKIYPTRPEKSEKAQVLHRIAATADELRKEVELLTAKLKKSEEENAIFKHYLWQIYKQLNISEQCGAAEAQGKALAKVARLK